MLIKDSSNPHYNKNVISKLIYIFYIYENQGFQFGAIPFWDFLFWNFPFWNYFNIQYILILINNSLIKININ